MTPGPHTLTVRVDNSAIWDIGYWSHAYSPEIQTIWNGIVGRMELQCTGPVWIERVEVHGDPLPEHGHERGLRKAVIIDNNSRVRLTRNILLVRLLSRTFARARELHTAVLRRVHWQPDSEEVP